MQLRRALGACALSIAVALGCGARSEPEAMEHEPVVECTAGTDCTVLDACELAACVAGVCRFTALDCDDGDECTEDACDPSSGCRHRALAVDRDDDGHFAPRPGFAPGEPGACGDDCDDTSSAAFPNAVELCDGHDNDCNGAIDEGARYAAAPGGVVRLSSLEAERAGHGGLVGLEGGFVLNLRERHPADSTKWQTLLLGIEAGGAHRFSTRVSMPNVPIEYGPLLWSGQELVTVWEDDREGGSYDVYLARFDALGRKLGPDVRLSAARSFSLNPSVLIDRSEYVVVWDDRRDERGGEGSRLYGQRISLEGELLGENVLLTPDDQGYEFPQIALGERHLGMVSARFGSPSRLVFQVLSSELEPIASAEPFAEDVRSASIDPIDGGFVVMWETYFPSGPGNELWAAVFDDRAELVVHPTRLASGASFLRGHSVLSFGDRLLVVWADDTNGNYDLFWQLFSANLAPLGERSVLVSGGADSLRPSLAIAPDGSVGVAFDDYRDGAAQVYFTTLTCE